MYNLLYCLVIITSKILITLLHTVVLNSAQVKYTSGLAPLLILTCIICINPNKSKKKTVTGITHNL